MLAMTARAAALAVVVGTANAACTSDKPPAEPVLGEAVGWIVIVGMRHHAAMRQKQTDSNPSCFNAPAGFGSVFTILTYFVSKYEMNKTGTKTTSEHFNTAGRNVGAGLTAAVIVSQWTWAATLLQSSNDGWQVGVSGTFWCGHNSTAAHQSIRSR